MADHSENSHVSVPGGKSGNQTAFPENTGPKGRTHFGPAPSPHRPAVENVFNTDKHGRRVPRDK